MSATSLCLKVQFQNGEGKLLVKDVKCSPLSTCISVKIEVAALFFLQSHRKYALYYKRQLIPSYNTLKDSSIVPGSTLVLALRSGPVTVKPVNISVRINQNGRPVKVSGAFSSDYEFLHALKSLKDADKNFNVLQEQSGALPVLSMASAQMDWKILQSLTGYTFNDLEIQGNQMFSLQYSPATESEIGHFKSTLESSLGPEINAKNRVSAVPTAPIKSITKATQEGEKASVQGASLHSSSNLIQFSASKQVPSSGSAPDLPDSFYDLTMEEWKSFQSGYKRNVQSIVDVPLVYSKYQQRESSPVLQKETIPIKFVFPNYVCVTALIPVSFQSCDLYSFLRDEIVSEDIQFKLLTGPPMKTIAFDNKPITQLGIITSTRIVVDCSCNDLRFKIDIQ